MPIKPILQLGNPLLKKRNLEVTDFGSMSLTNALTDLKDTMNDANLIGIAAPQIGINLKLFLTQPRKTSYRKLANVDELRTYINPELVWASDETVEIFEGCGCVEDVDLFGPVLRPKIIEVKAFSEMGKQFSLRCDGILARVIQHELDHLEGIEFIEKVMDRRRCVNMDYYSTKIKDSETQVENSLITIKDFKHL